MSINKIAWLTDIHLEELRKEGFVFRGHESFKYTLTPNAFRDSGLVRMKNEFGIHSSTINKWFKNKFIMQHVNTWLPRLKITSSGHQVINRLLKYCLYLMQYNHSLNLFVQNNAHRVSQKDKNTILERSLEYWKSEETFQLLFSSYFPRIIRRYHLDGTLIQDANLFEDLASVDETLLQHYDTPTAALDWTFNYNVSIYFAIGEKEVEDKFLTIYALKIHDTTLSPFYIMDKSIHVENKRAERQEGTFTYFTKPCSFYMQHEHHPSINYFDQRYKNNLAKRTFELKEFVVERSKENISYLKKIIEHEGINKDFLFPNEKIKYLEEVSN